MKHVIIDFDNTMGVPGCDVDDGLALLYLLGKPEDVVVEGICCTYGNSDIDTVAGNTRRICRELGLHVPVFKGGASALDPTSDAARFLAEAVAKRPGEISILLLLAGARNRAYGRHHRNPARERPRARRAQPLVRPPGLLPGARGCLPGGRRHSTGLPTGRVHPRPLRPRTGRRFLAHAPGEGLVRLHDRGLRHERLRLERFDVTLNPRILQVGYIERAPHGAPSSTISIPRIADPEAFRTACFSAWKRALARYAPLPS